MNKLSKYLSLAILISIFSILSQASHAQTVICAFTLMKLEPNKVNAYDRTKNDQPSFGYSTPDPPFETYARTIIDFDKGTYTEIEGHPDGDITYQWLATKLDNVRLMTSGVDPVQEKDKRYPHDAIIYFPSSHTAISFHRDPTGNELLAEEKGFAPYLHKKEAIARIDPHLSIDIAPCRDATEEDKKHIGEPYVYDPNDTFE